MLINAVSWEEGEGTRKIICIFGSRVVDTLIQIGFFKLKKVSLYFVLFPTFISKGYLMVGAQKRAEKAKT